MTEIQQEICPITGEDLFIILDRPNVKFEYPIHCHPEYEINVVINSNGTRVIGDSEESFSGLDFVMLGPYVSHVWKSEQENNHEITIQFSGDLLNFHIMNKRLFMPIKQLLMDSMQGLHFYGEEAERIKDEIMDLTKMQGFQTATKFLNILSIDKDITNMNLRVGDSSTPIFFAFLSNTKYAITYKDIICTNYNIFRIRCQV